MSSKNIKKRRTFHQLKGIIIEEACFSSDGEPIKGTEEKLVLLYNSSRVSDDQVEFLLNSGTYSYSQEIAVVPFSVAMNLSDLEKEEKENERSSE